MTRDEQLKEELRNIKATVSETKEPEPEEETEEQEEPEEEKKTTSSEGVKFVVVKELPVQEIRTAKDKDGTIINFITLEEALTKLLNKE